MWKKRFFWRSMIVPKRNSGQIKDDYTIKLPRPGDRIAPQFQHWKETILKSRDLSLIDNADPDEEEKYA
jgi:hypothetical protein